MPSNPHRFLNLAKTFATVLMLTLLVAHAVLIVQARWWGSPSLGDFALFYESAQAANRGLNPFISQNLNPPIVVYPIQLLTSLSPWSAFWAWTCISVALYLLAVVLLLRSKREPPTMWLILWLGIWSPIWCTLELGQLYTVLLLASTGAWISIESKRYTLAGLCIGIFVAIKPTFLIWPVLLLLSGERRASLSGMVTFTCLSAIPFFISGPSIYADWYNALPSLALLRTKTVTFFGNVSIQALAVSFDIPPLAILVTPLVAIGGLLLAFRFYRTQLTANHHSSTEVLLLASQSALLVSLLIGPLSWQGYLLVLLPGLILLPSSRISTGVAVVFVLPYWLVILLETGSDFAYRILEPIFGIAVILLLYDAVQRAKLLSKTVPISMVQKPSEPASKSRHQVVGPTQRLKRGIGEGLGDI